MTNFKIKYDKLSYGMQKILQLRWIGATRKPPLRILIEAMTVMNRKKIQVRFYLGIVFREVARTHA